MLTALRKSRLLNVMNALVIRGFGTGLSVLLTLFVTRHLETSAAANFLLVFNVSTVAAVCFRWGLDDVIVRRVAAGRRADSPPVASYLMRLAHHRVAVWVAFSASVSAAFALIFLNQPAGLGLPEILAATFVSALIGLTACAGRVHQGLGRTNLAAAILNVVVPAFLLLGLLILVGLGLGVNSWILQMVYVGVSLLTYLVVVWAFPLTRPYRRGCKVRLDVDAGTIKADRKAANRLGGVIVSQQALNWTALLVVPITYGDQLFTSFMVTYKVAGLISLAVLAVNMTFASRLAALFASHKLRELKRLTRIMVVSVIVAGAIAGCAILLARTYIYSFAEVGPIDDVLALLCVAQVFYALSSVYALVLSMGHDESFLLKAHGSIVATGVSLFVVVSFVAPLEAVATIMLVTYVILTVVLRRRVIRVVSRPIEVDNRILL